MIQQGAEDHSRIMPDPITIQLTETEYRLVIDGTPTEPAAFGESLECEFDGHKYMCLLDLGDDEGDEVESSLDSWVYVDGMGVDEPGVVMEDVDGASFSDDPGDVEEEDVEGEGDESEDTPEEDHNITQK